MSGTSTKLDPRSVVDKLVRSRGVSLQCVLRPQAPIRLQRWVGATFRGGLGHALMALDDERQTHCFDELFGDRRPRVNDGALRGQNVTPLVVRAPFATKRRTLAAGRALRLRVHLAGFAGHLLPSITDALILFARRGFGDERVPCELTVRDAWGTVATSSGGVLRQPILASLSAERSPVSAMRLFTESPLQLRRAGSSLDAPTFDDILGASIRRLATIASASGESLESIPLRELAAAFDGVRAVDSQWRTVRLQRRSERQDRKYAAYGVVGSARFEGDLGLAVPLLAGGAFFGIGKGVSFGLGALGLEREP